MDDLIKDSRFELVTEIQKPDAKKRLSLGLALEESAAAYNIYRNALGQIVLDPVKAVPLHETWLYESPAALASIKRGLKESAEGKRIHRGSFAKYSR